MYFSIKAGEDRWETESGTFMKLMAQRSFPHLQLVFIEYKSVSGGQDILNAMKQESSRDYFKLLSVLGEILFCLYQREELFLEKNNKELSRS